MRIKALAMMGGFGLLFVYPLITTVVPWHTSLPITAKVRVALQVSAAVGWEHW